MTAKSNLVDNFLHERMRERFISKWHYTKILQAASVVGISHVPNPKSKRLIGGRIYEYFWRPMGRLCQGGAVLVPNELPDNDGWIQGSHVVCSDFAQRCGRSLERKFLCMPTSLDDRQSDLFRIFLFIFGMQHSLRLS